MIYLLFTALIYLTVTSCIFFWNRKVFTPLRSLKNYVLPTCIPKVSICIPARNEENNIKRSVSFALAQRYEALEVLVLDDNSSDRTPEILNAIDNSSNHKLKLIEGKPKPNDWLGKSWACHQLSKHASGEILIFIDADVWLEPEATLRVIRTMGHDVVDFLTVWPRQELRTFWEKTIIPLVYYSLFTLLPFACVHKFPRWIPAIFRRKLSPFFAAATGQFMAFKRSAYEAIGGHESVKHTIVEDVELAKNIKRHGFSMKMYNGISAVHCRMYTSLDEIQQGFRKNFLAGFNYNIPLFIFMGLLHIIVYILPAITLIVALFTNQILTGILSAACILTVIIQRLLMDSRFRWERKYSLTHILGVGWFQILGIIVLQDYFKNKMPTWKGRPVSEKKN